MKHLLSAKDLTHDEAVMVLDTAEAMAATQRHAVKKLPTLRGKTVVNLFFEDSTRTRLSFEAAAKRLSADVINFSAKGSSVSKGESRSAREGGRQPRPAGAGPGGRPPHHRRRRPALPGGPFQRGPHDGSRREGHARRTSHTAARRYGRLALRGLLQPR